MIAILKKELRQFFGSLSGYLIIACFLLLNGLWLWVLRNDANILDSGFADLTLFFTTCAWLFVLLIPAFTMRSFADEFKAGTLEILKTKPLSTSELIAGKFLANVIIIAIALLPTLIYVYSIYQLAVPIGNIDLGSIAGSYIGLLFVASALVSLGLWVSSSTKNQLYAILGAMVLSYLFYDGIQGITDLLPETLQSIESIGMYAHFQSIARGVLDSRDLWYFIAFCSLFLSFTYGNLSTKKTGKKRLYLIAAIAVVSYLSKQVYARIDLTEDKRYTLSDASVAVAKSIDETTVIRVYLQGDFPAEFKRLQLETKQLLEELKATNNKLKVLFIDPKEQLESLIKRGLSPSRLTVEENGVVSESIVLPWATIAYKNKTANISLLKDSAPNESQTKQLENSIQNLEYAFTNALHKVSASKEKSIAVLQGNGQLEDIYLYDFLKSLGNSYHLAKFTLDSVANNPVKTLQQLNAYDLVIIAKPTKAFSEEEKYALDQYSLQGGHSIWMLDYVHAEMDSLYNSGKTLAYPRELNLDDFFFRYGARFKPNLVKDLYASKISLATGNTGNKTNYQKFLWYYAPLVSATAKHPIVNNIGPVNFQFTSSIDTLKNSIQKTVLLSSSVLSKAVNTPAIIELNTVTEPPSPKLYNQGNQILAVLLEGAFNSAYKDRLKPFAYKNSTETGIPAKMILIGDGDIARNQIHNGKPLALGTDKWTQEFYANKEFLTNAVAYILDDNGLISIRSKTISLKVLNKKESAQNKFFWQLLNLGFPLLLLLLSAAGVLYYRKRKYTKPGTN